MRLLVVARGSTECTVDAPRSIRLLRVFDGAILHVLDSLPGDAIYLKHSPDGLLSYTTAGESASLPVFLPGSTPTKA